MNQKPTHSANAQKRRHLTVALSVAAFAFTMVGAAYAAVPLYELFCKVTGYGGTTQIAEQAPDVIVDHEITVHFDANVASKLPWDFKPTERAITLKIGEVRQTAYHARNKQNHVTWGTSTFNVTPDAAGAYFNKIQCFCFEEQKLGAGQDLDMPVVFFIDPAILDDPDTASIKNITLSYTMFPVKNPPHEPVAAATPSQQQPTALR